MDEGATTGAEDEDYVRFLAAGEPAVGEFRCSECGYGVSIYRVLPRCPMCSGTSWEAARAVVLQ